MRNVLIVIGIVVVLGVMGYFLSDNGSEQASPISDNQVREVQESEVSKDCTGELTPALTEGPYYKAGSPERKNIAQGAVGEKLTVTGFVFNQNCEPVVGAWLDFWQADGNGDYDNAGFNLRGHQFTDSEGRYALETILPARYSGRTPHIHVKVRANENSPILTSQLFFPGEDQNARDSIFNQALVVKMEEGVSKTATFNFVVKTN